MCGVRRFEEKREIQRLDKVCVCWNGNGREGDDMCAWLAVFAWALKCLVLKMEKMKHAKTKLLAKFAYVRAFLSERV